MNHFDFFFENSKKGRNWKSIVGCTWLDKAKYFPEVTVSKFDFSHTHKHTKKEQPDGLVSVWALSGMHADQSNCRITRLAIPNELKDGSKISYTERQPCD